MITWKTTLHCETCGAMITIQDEKPEWKVDEKIQAAYEEAKRWVEQNAEKDFGIYEQLPDYVSLNSGHDIFKGMAVLADPPEMRYIPCPCCEDKVYPESGRPTAGGE